MNVVFNLENQTAVGLINLLGKMPVDSGVSPLRDLLIMQYNAQIEPPKEEPAPEAPSADTATPPPAPVKPSRTRKKS